MTAGRRLVNFGLVTLVALAVWFAAGWLWPYLELIAPLGALIIILLVINVLDGLRFAVQHRRRLARSASATPPQRTAGARVPDTASASAIELRGTR